MPTRSRRPSGTARARSTDAGRHRRGRQRRPLDRPRAARQRSRGPAHRQGPAGHQDASRCPTPSGCSPTPARSTSLEEAGLHECQVVVAATGDDKVNLVVSLLAKTEYGVPRTVARVNNPKNEWMFDEAWGVDVAVSTPRLMTALVEEAVSVGDLVRIFTFQQANTDLVELTLPADSPDGRHPGRRRRLAARHGAGRDHPRGPADRAEPGRPARGRRRAAVRRHPGHGSAARGAARPARAPVSEVSRARVRAALGRALAASSASSWPTRLELGRRLEAWLPACNGVLSAGEQPGHQRRARRPAAASRAPIFVTPEPARPCRRGRAGTARPPG